MLLFVCDNDVDIVLAAKAMIHGGEQAIGVGGQINTYDVRALVRDNIKETGILVSKAIVVLSPYSSCEEDVERGDLLSPLDFETLLDPLAVLVHHAVNNVNEGLIAVEQTMSS